MASPDAGSSGFIIIKHAGVQHEISLDPKVDCVYTKISALLGLPKHRIKVIRLGKLLPPPGDPALATAVVSGGVYMVSGTAAHDALPSEPRRRAALALDAIRELLASLTLATLYAWLLWMWTTIIAVPRVAISFVSSMVVAPPARPPPAGALRQHVE